MTKETTGEGVEGGGECEASGRLGGYLLGYFTALRGGLCPGGRLLTVLVTHLPQASIRVEPAAGGMW